MDPQPTSSKQQGLQALQNGHLERAIEYLSRAVLTDPDDADARVLLGIAYSQQGLHDLAIASLETAVAAQPHHADYRYNLGVVRQRARDSAGAMAAYRDALRLDPQHQPARMKVQALETQGITRPAMGSDAMRAAGEGLPSRALETMPHQAPARGDDARSRGVQVTSSQAGVESTRRVVPPSPISRVSPPRPLVGGEMDVPGHNPRPNRGELIFGLGIASLLLTCLPLGIATWVMANRDLEARDRGEMEPIGSDLTRIGRALAIAGTVLSVICAGFNLMSLLRLISAFTVAAGAG